MAMTYAIHSTVRGQQTRTQRATQGQHARLKQHVGEKQRRLIRGRPLIFSEEDFLKSLPEIKEKAEMGILEVRTVGGELIDLETLQPRNVAPAPTPLPAPPMDSIARDAPWGEKIPPLPGDVLPEGTGEPTLLTQLGDGIEEDSIDPRPWPTPEEGEVPVEPAPEEEEVPVEPAPEDVPADRETQSGHTPNRPHRAHQKKVKK